MSGAGPTRHADGRAAEALAARLLEDRGLAIVARNRRTRRGEIDLVALDGDCLVFVEVRLRRGGAHGDAAASLTPRKRARMIAAAEDYLAGLASEPPCRFDVVLLDGLAPERVRWLRDVIDTSGDD
ncbi:MAG: YraN family protein [Burkholderiales bacterium]